MLEIRSVVTIDFRYLQILFYIVKYIIIMSRNSIIKLECVLKAPVAKKWPNWTTEIVYDNKL